MTKRQLIEMIKRVIKEEANKWSVIADGKAEYKNPNGKGYYVISADENVVFTYSISLHKADNTIEYIQKNIDGESDINKYLRQFQLPLLSTSDIRKLHDSASNYYDYLDELN